MTTTKKPRRMARPALDIGTDTDIDIDTDNVRSPAALAPIERRPTKQDLVLALLQGEGGVPLGTITQATGWLPHTVRAALTGLRKKGHGVTRTKVDGETAAWPWRWQRNEAHRCRPGCTGDDVAGAAARAVGGGGGR